MEHIESVKVMIENFRSEDPELRLRSMRGIHLIASTLGPARTRDELLLYLTDYLDDNDEVLRVFANAMGTMVHEVGGVGFVESLLSPLEILAGLDEVTVRDEAVASLQHIGDAIFPKAGTSNTAGSSSGSSGAAAADAQARFTAIVERMANGTPQSRSSACHLFPSVYASTAPGAEQRKQRVMELFKAQCSYEEIMVRRAACVSVGKSFVPVLGARDCASLIPFVTAFASDRSDGVRLQAVSAAIAMLKALPETQHGPILACVKSLAGDASWRVRYMVADSLGGLSAAISPSDEAKYVVATFLALCKDAEPEIRASAVFNMAQVLAGCRDADHRRDILITGTHMVEDENSHVRTSLASAVLKSVAHVPEALWGSDIMPACTALLGDVEADVRLALVSSFSSMGNTSEARELAPLLVPQVIALAKDGTWRLREAVVSQLPYIIPSLGRNMAEEEEIVKVCVDCLTDRVATIREAAVQSCCKLIAENGSAWAVTTLFPHVMTIARDGNYLHRVSLCHFFAALANIAGFERSTCTEHVWPVLLQLQKDPVANVRLNTAKAVLALQRAEKVDKKAADTVIATLGKDSCEDVRDAARTDSGAARRKG